MARGLIAAILALVLALAGGVGRAEPPAALAHLDPVQSAITRENDQTVLRLALSQAVPFRSYFLGAPPRLVIDLNEVDFGAARPGDLRGADLMAGLRWGRVRPGWSRLVAELDQPYRLDSAAIPEAAQGGAVLELRLRPVPAADFQPEPGAAQSALMALPQPEAMPVPRRRQSGLTALRVVIDPGHGGIDSGAEYGAVREKDLMLIFARELAEQLIREGVDVSLTRSDDRFISLERRMTIARAQGADLFLSLHADALAEGQASGATVYLFDVGSSDRAAAQLSAFHDRGDLLAGVDLDGTDDALATVLMDLARRETGPRARRFAKTLLENLRAHDLPVHKRPIQGAFFGVLKSPDIPSVLLELGFLSSGRDRERLTDPAWRARMALAIRDAVAQWAMEDAAEAARLRQ